MLWNDTFRVFDNTQSSSGAAAKAISFVDLIGQPTWIDLNVIQVTFPMRADIHIGDYLTLPPGLVTTTTSSFSPFRQGSAFQGTFLVRTLRHVGSFRQADAQAWVTIVDAVGSPVPAGNVTIENLQLSQ